MWCDCFERCYVVGCVVWYIVVAAFINTVRATPTSDDSLNKPCQAGFFRSKFLSGGCTPCVEPKYCKHEQTGDDKRCLDACGKLKVLLNSTTTAVTPLNTTEEPTSPTTKSSQVSKKISDENFEVASETKPADNETTTRNPTKTKEASSQTDNKVIILGVVCSIVALAILFVLIFIWYKHQHDESNAGQAVTSLKSHYVVVSSVSNSNEDIKGSRTMDEKQPEVPADEESTWDIQSSCSSLSRTELNELRETDL